MTKPVESIVAALESLSLHVTAVSVPGNGVDVRVILIRIPHAEQRRTGAVIRYGDQSAQTY